MDIDARHMKWVHPALLKHTFKKGHHVSNGAWSKFKWWLLSIGLTLPSSSSLNMLCLSSNPLLNWWQTPGVLQPSPLKGIASRDSMRKTFKGRETCHSVSNISDSIRLLNFGASERLIWSWHFLILVLRSKFCLKNFLRWPSWSIVTLGRNPR